MISEFQNITPCALVALSLAACGGGGGGGDVIPPVYSPGVPATPTDFVGKTFPILYFGQLATGSGPKAARGEGSIEVVSQTEVVLTYNGSSATLTDPDMDGNFTTADSFASFDEETSDLRILEAFTIDGDLVFGLFGFQTAPSDLASESTGAYLGVNNSTLAFVDSSGSSLINLNGDTLLSINFGTGNVSGTVFDDGAITLSLVGGNINGAGTISGQLAMTVPDGGGGTMPSDVFNTDVDARIYGAGAERLAGTFEGDLVAPVVADEASFVGGFIAEEFTP